VLQLYSFISLGVFISATLSMALPLLQSKILDVSTRARSADRFIDWQQEGEIVSAWISQLKAQGELAPGALGAFLGFHWDAECKRQIALNHPAVVAAHSASRVASQQ
jgi:hypothetical protein